MGPNDIRDASGRRNEGLDLFTHAQFRALRQPRSLPSEWLPKCVRALHRT